VQGRCIVVCFMFVLGWGLWGRGERLCQYVEAPYTLD
jgi:hypothetical protein